VASRSSEVNFTKNYMLLFTEQSDTGIAFLHHHIQKL